MKKMYKFKIIILFFLINTIYGLENSKKNGDTFLFEKIKKKRDMCALNDQAEVILNGLEVITKGLDFLTDKKKDPIKFLETLSSIAGFTGSLYGFNSVSICDIDKKLDIILLNMVKISNDIKILQASVDSIYINKLYSNLSNELEKFLNSFRETFVNKSEKLKEELLNSIKKKCLDINSGINNLYQVFLLIMNDKNINDYFRLVVKYDSNYYSNWSKQIVKFTIEIFLVIKGCEEALNKTSNIDMNSFFYVTKTNLARFDYLIIENFVKEKYETGLYQSIIRVVSEGKSANDTAKTLKESYAFFDWTVIFYPDDIGGFEKHTAYTKNNDEYEASSGSYHFVKQFDKRNALIAWSIPSTIKTENYLKEKSNDILRSGRANRIARRLKNNLSIDINFVLAVKSDQVEYFCISPCYSFGTISFNNGGVKLNSRYEKMTGLIQPRVVYSDLIVLKKLKYETTHLIFI